MTARWALAARLAWRDLRSGFAGFRIFLASLALGVAALAGVGSLGQAFLTGLAEQGRTLLGGDVGLQLLYRPASPDETAFMARYGRVSEFASLRSMAANARESGKRTLIELKAVDGAYPLVGAMVLFPAMPLARALSCDEAVCGAVVEDALLTRLGVHIGDRVHIGSTDFIVRARIVSEPDRVAGGFALGPQVLVARQGLQRAGLVTQGSLITYSYRIAFPQTAPPEIFRAAAAARFPQAGWRITDRTNAIPNVTRFVEQATMFLALVGLTALVVGGVGAGQAVSAFLDRRRATIATLKAIGATGGDIFRIYLTQIMTVAAFGLVIGLVLGAALPFAVKRFFGADIPAPAHYALYPAPLLLAAAFGVLAALGFAIPPLARAREIAPAGLFRDLVAPAPKQGRWPYRAAAAAAFAAIAALAVALSPYPRFALEFLGGAAAVLALLRVAALGLSRLLKRLHPRRGQILRLALTNLTRPGAPVSAIIVALGLGLTLLATVALVQASVEADVRDQLPDRAPSFFFIDIQENEIGPFTALIESVRGDSDFTATPMLRGRIVKLNGAPADPSKVAADARWALNGDRGVTYATVPPKDSSVVAGPSWWPADYRGPSLVSFDAQLARGMGLKLGDTITVNLLGRDIDLKIFNLRDIEYRTGGINFAMVASPGVIDRAPHSYVATVRTADADEDALFAAISKKFPNVTVVRVKEALAQVGELLATLAEGVEAASLVTILAGILVLAGAIAAGHQARLYDAVVLKVLGATRARLAAVYAVEYGVLGMLSGLVALGAGTLAAACVARFVLDIPFVFSGAALLFTIAGGAALTLIFGLAGGFAALSARPARRLRNS